MEPEFKLFFEKYETIAANADEAFRRIREAYPDEVVCKPGCTDCCYALFDLTLVEAIYLNHHFNRIFSGPERQEMLERANLADRKIYKLKRDAFKKTREGVSQEKVVEEMAAQRIRCPLLNENALCALYEHRPMACRIYGAPLAIGGNARTCGKTGFKEGTSYTTINMDAIHEQLLKISAEFVRAIGSRHVSMGDVLVPVSMAMLTDYNEEYLGIDSGKGSGDDS